MKISDAWIDDPTLSGKLEPPSLCIETDSMPDQTIPSQEFSGNWLVGKYGPFVRYENKDHPVDSGDYNKRFSDRFPVVVDITLCVPGAGSYKDFSLPLTRARQLVKKFDSKWRLLLNDRVALERGVLVWAPVESFPACRHWLGEETCGRHPARPIRVSGVDLPLCELHVREHNDLHAAKRTTHHQAS